jgi:mono/diheme cytochrome c family protein
VTEPAIDPLCLRRLAIAASPLVLLAIALGACGNSQPRQPVSAEARAEAARIYEQRCATCHGRQGWGDGVEAAKLERRPRNFSDPTWQLAVSDSHLDKVILEGGPAVGKSQQMPANPDLAQRRDVLTALRQHLRVLASNPGP